MTCSLSLVPLRSSELRERADRLAYRIALHVSEGWLPETNLVDEFRLYRDALRERTAQ